MIRNLTTLMLLAIAACGPTAGSGADSDDVGGPDVPAPRGADSARSQDLDSAGPPGDAHTPPGDDLEEQVAGASAGEVITLEARVYELKGTLIVPPGVSLEGAGAEETELIAAPGEVGMRLLDDTSASGFTLRSATDVGVEVAGIGEVTIQDVVVRQTSAGSARPGHGLYMADLDGAGSKLALVDVSAEDNDGSGLHVEDPEVEVSVIGGTWRANGGAGLHFAGAEGGCPLGIVLPCFLVGVQGALVEGNGAGGIELTCVVASVDDTDVRGNAGPGIRAGFNAGILVQEGELADNGDAGIDGAGAFALWLSEVQVTGNEGAGVRLVEPVETDAAALELADPALVDLVGDKLALGLVIDGGSVSGNRAVGVERSGGRGTRIKGVEVFGQTAPVGVVETPAIGIWLRERTSPATDLFGEAVATQQETVEITETTVLSNEGAGIVIEALVAGTLQGEIRDNAIGGLWVQGEGVAVTVDPDTKVQDNGLIGAVATNGGRIAFEGGEVSGTLPVPELSEVLGEGAADSLAVLAGGELSLDGANLQSVARAHVLAWQWQDGDLGVNGNTFGDAPVGVALADHPDNPVFDGDALLLGNTFEQVETPLLPVACYRFVHSFCSPVTDCVHEPAAECEESVCPAWFEDADGDGFGHSGKAMTSCVDPGAGWSQLDTDCADGDAQTYPGAVEVCDGVANDCDDAGWESDDGIVSKLDEVSGLWVDGSELVGTDPAELVHVNGAVTARYCPGEYVTRLQVNDSLIAEGWGDTELDVVLTGLDAHTVVTMAQDTDVSLTNLSVAHGAGAFAGGVGVGPNSTLVATSVLFEDNTMTGFSGGGAIGCAQGTLDISNSSFLDNHSTGGGALLTAECNGTLQANFQGNTATDGDGGALNLWTADSGVLAIVDSTFTGNSSTGSGGAIAVRGPATLTDSSLTGNSASQGGAVFVTASGALTIEDSLVTGNSVDAGSPGSGVLVAGELECSGTPGTEPLTGITGNLPVGVVSRDVTLQGDATFLADVCDLGSVRAIQGPVWTPGNDASGFCDESGCTPD